MKKRIFKICISILILLAAVRAALRRGTRIATIMIGCLIIVVQSHEKKYEPDDIISEAIYEAVGDKKVRYCGEQYSKPGNLGVSGEIATYTYEIRDHEDANLLTNMVEAANAVMKEKKVKQKISITIREEFVSRAYRSAVGLRNYYVSEEGYEQYETLQYLYIGETVFDSSPYGKAETYTSLPDIKRLVVSREIAKDAEEEGIDWYEIWPDLEYYEISEN